jgi:two-component system nitrate/nitrite response regulator NarL
VTTRSVCIVEDHPMMREFLAEQVRAHTPDAQIRYAGPSIVQAEATVTDSPADCVILDLDLGDDSDLQDNLRRMIATGSPVLIVSASASARLVQRAIAGGAHGYVSKQCEPEEFVRAYSAVLDGRTYVSPDLAAKLAVPAIRDVRLSPQEQRALSLYASGMKLEAVARTMGVQVGTAKEYIRRVRDKYAAAGDPLPSKVDLYRKAHEEGLL